MLLLLPLLCVVASVQARPEGRAVPLQERPESSRQFLYIPERQQQYHPDLQYDLSLLEPQFQIPNYHFGDKQNYPARAPQPQILFYGGSAPGQPFLLQPGGAPPNNFLPGPNVVLRGAPQRPLFVAGYPKPAHIPPVEKDAEEVPTDPSRIPAFGSKDEKPEKLETFGDEAPKRHQGGSDTEYLGGTPLFQPRPNLQPGQRFFILNGQPLFSNYPSAYPGLPQEKPQFPRNGGLPENVVLLNQPGVVLRSGSPLTKDVKLQETPKSDYSFLQIDDQDNDAIIIEARENDSEDGAVATTTTESDGDVVSAPEKIGEPTIAQAQPGAIALAGPGGVASAAPRGTAFVGKEGIAVSSPQATAVAGPSKEEEPEKTKKAANKRKP